MPIFLKLYQNYWTIKRSGLFDHAYYLSHYPDIRKADIDPLQHFVKYGWKEGRNPSAFFNTNFYLQNNPDVSSADINPLIHYIKFGQQEGRKANPDDPGIFISRPGSIEKITAFFRLFSIKNLKRSIYYIRSYGFGYFLKAAKTRLFPKKEFFSQPIEAPSTSVSAQLSLNLYNSPDDLEKHPEKISVIIPVKNAGDDFRFLLQILKNQIGISDIEIVVVDSGSTDDSLAIANAYGANIINILPEEFSHSYARNLGAENATGDYLLFTVQDALPPSETWLYEMLTILKTNEVCAVSCAEYPRENADLFYRVLAWNHYNFLGVTNNDRVLKLPDNPNYISLRQNGQLSDIACLIPIDLFKKYKYRFDYAEDLDLGIRLIKDGQKIAFLGLTRIIHSHNRPAYYFLKRGYVDNLFLSDMFEDFPRPVVEFKKLARDIVFTCNFVMEVIIKKLLQVPALSKVSAIESALEEAFRSISVYKAKSVITSKLDKSISDSYLVLLQEISKEILDQPNEAYNGILLDSIKEYLRILFSYLNGTYEFVDQDTIEEIKNFILKAMSQLIGAYLAYSYQCSPDKTDDKISRIHLTLKAGV